MWPHDSREPVPHRHKFRGTTRKPVPKRESATRVPYSATTGVMGKTRSRSSEVLSLGRCETVKFAPHPDLATSTKFGQMLQFSIA